MYRFSVRALPIVAALVAATCATPAFAQLTLDGNAYYTTAADTLAADISGFDVFVGKTSLANFATVPGNATLTINPGATVTGFGDTYPDTESYYGIAIFDNYGVTVTGGDVDEITAYDTSRLDIADGTFADIGMRDTSTATVTGGTFASFYIYDTSAADITGGDFNTIETQGFAIMNISLANVVGATAYDNSVMNLTGGDSGRVVSHNDGVVNISGGTHADFGGFEFGVINVSGGTISGTFNLYESSTINFFGTGFTTSYAGSGFDFQNNECDAFDVSGTVGGVLKSYVVNVRNAGTPDPTPRRFNFLAPVVVPEAGTLALLGLGCWVLGAVVVRRREVSLTA